MVLPEGTAERDRVARVDMVVELVRASEGCVQVVAVGQTVPVVVFCAFQLSLVMTTLPEPANWFVPTW